MRQNLELLRQAVASADAVDERRADLGLEALHVHLARAGEGMPEDERTQAVQDVLRHRHEADAFARSVGWR